MRMRGWIRGRVVRAQVGFHFNDATRDGPRAGPADKQFAQQTRSHTFRILLKKRARHQAARSLAFLIETSTQET